MESDKRIFIFSQRPRSSSKPGHRNRGDDQQRYTREKYNSDLIVPYNMSRMPVAKKKVYEVCFHIFFISKRKCVTIF